MSDNHLKNPLLQSLNQFAQKKAVSRIQELGKALPCSVVSVNGAIVTVQFNVNSEFTLPQVTIPLFGPIYIRYPIQPGDLGIVIPADAYLGGVSGLGGGVASLTARNNLSALVFLPIGNTAWSTVDPSAVTIYGPNGVVLRDTASGSIFTLTPTTIAISTQDSYEVTCGATTFKTTPSGWTLSGTTGNLQDGTAHTSPSIMSAAWNALVVWANTHTHPVSGSEATATDKPYSGGSIAPT